MYDVVQGFAAGAAKIPGGVWYWPIDAAVIGQFSGIAPVIALFERMCPGVGSSPSMEFDANGAWAVPWPRWNSLRHYSSSSRTWPLT